jgi:undecaprenyl-diphosphatase
MSTELRAGTWQRVLAADRSLLVATRRWQTPLVTRAMRTATALGDAHAWVAFGLLLLAHPATRAAGMALGMAAMLATCAVQVLKRTCRRSRPTQSIGGFVALVENPDCFSFPSGHTTTAVSVAVALAGQGDLLCALAAMLAAGVAISRVYLGAHYPLDVAAGALVGTATGLLTRLTLG